MRAPPDVTDDGPQAPLGRPVNRPAPVPDDGRWVPVDGSPHTQRNTATGRMRNVRPTPPAAPVPHPWYGWPVSPPKP